jgi:large subunit ribosomal protein L23
LFGVKVTGVWTSNQRGKVRRVGKSAGRRPNWKKAIVTLREGDAIEGIFEG